MSPVRALLRAETAAAHERVDAAFGAADLSTRAGYAAFLTAQAAAHLPVEAALEAVGVEAVVADWAGRKRADLLRADLAELDVATLPVIDPPMFEGAAAILGGVYVLEGSRMGGAMLRRSVGAGLPVRFLGANPSGAWRDLVQLLDVELVSEQDRNRAVASARAVFGCFERAGAELMKAR